MRNFIIMGGICFTIGLTSGYFLNSPEDCPEVSSNQDEACNVSQNVSQMDIDEQATMDQEKINKLKAELDVIGKYSDLMFGYVCVATETGNPQNRLEEIEKSIIETEDSNVLDEYKKINEASQKDLIPKAIPGFMRFLVKDVKDKL